MSINLGTLSASATGSLPDPIDQNGLRPLKIRNELGHPSTDGENTYVYTGEVFGKSMGTLPPPTTAEPSVTFGTTYRWAARCRPLE